MDTLHFTIDINAPAGRVWSSMLDDATYREWTAVAFPGSFYTGGWNRGDEIRFLGTDEDGSLGGMIGRIVESRPDEHVSIEYTGQVVGGVDDVDSDDARAIRGTHENYTFSERDGVTTVEVDVDVDEKYSEMFSESWPASLEKLKEIAERDAG
jgi:uncharacterized protein YndB with AHSA1/START domain